MQKSDILADLVNEDARNVLSAVKAARHETRHIDGVYRFFDEAADLLEGPKTEGVGEFMETLEKRMDGLERDLEGTLRMVRRVKVAKARHAASLRVYREAGA